MNNFYAQHQNMMSLLVRSSNAPGSDIKCLSLQYTTYTHANTHYVTMHIQYRRENATSAVYMHISDLHMGLDENMHVARGDGS